MKILKKILLGLAILIGVVLLIAAILPKKYHVERSVSINAPQDVVMTQVKSLKNMQTWSPWADKDPNMTSNFTGVDGEVGSMHEWKGNDEVGEGKQEITKVTNDRVETKLTFIKPWEEQNLVFIQTTPEASFTKVTWGFDGDMAYPMNLLNLFNVVDKSVGPDFEKGLFRLKAKCESMNVAPLPQTETGSH